MYKQLIRQFLFVGSGAFLLALAPAQAAWAQSLGGSNAGSERQFLPIPRGHTVQGIPLRGSENQYIPLNADTRFSRESKMIPLAGTKPTLTRLSDVRHQVMRNKATEVPNDLKLVKPDREEQIAALTPETVARPWVVPPVAPLYPSVPEEDAAQDMAETVEAAEEHEGIETLDDAARPVAQGRKSGDTAGEVAFYWPLAAEDYRGISSGYGTRIHPVTRKKSFHAGIDLPAPTGTPVLAAAAGEVTGVGEHPRLGRYVKITHADDSYSLYGHLSQYTVRMGTQVAAGDRIGKVGSTGRSTGPHLDFSIRKDGAPMDPMAFLPSTDTLMQKTLALAE